MQDPLVILAVDPGPEQSAYVTYDEDARLITDHAKVDNQRLRPVILDAASVVDLLAIEMVASYGMPVGADVFQTCVWIGRFVEDWALNAGRPCKLIARPDIKLHLCHSRRAKDPNVRQALIDRFGPGKEQAVGRKATPGPLYGISGDCWSALAVAVTTADQIQGVGV